MPYILTCKCGQEMSVPDEAVGKTGRCVNCGRSIKISMQNVRPAPLGVVPPTPPGAGAPGYGAGPGIPPPPRQVPPPGAWSAGYDSGGSRQVCPNCGTTLEPDAILCTTCGFDLRTGQTFGTQAAAGVRTGPPWENRSQLGFFSALFQTVKGVLLAPTATFSNMRIEGGVGSPLLFAVIFGTVATVVAAFFQLAMVAMGLARGLASQGDWAAGVGAAAFVFGSVVAAHLFIAMGLFVGSGITHICLVIVGGAKQGFEATFRVLAYTTGATSLLSMVPCIGMVAGIWGLVCEVIGLSKAHEISTGKALIAVLLPLIACCTCIGLGFLIFGAALMQNLEQMVPTR